MLDATRVYTAFDTSFVSSGTQTVTALCDSGDVATGGGCSMSNNNAALRHSTPNGVAQVGDAPNGWYCNFQVASNTTINAWAICVDVTP